MERARSWLAWLGRGSLLLRFSLLSLVVLALIAAGLATTLEHEMTQDALRQQADEVAVVVRGVFDRPLVKATRLMPARRPTEYAWWASLAQGLLAADSHLVRVKVWDPSGRIIYSNNPAQIGRAFPIDDDLRAALAGRPAMGISHLTGAENAGDPVTRGPLLQTYIPIHKGGVGPVIGAYEAYCDLGLLTQRLDATRGTIWGSVAAGFLLLYAALFAIVRSASRGRCVRSRPWARARARRTRCARSIA